MPKGADLASLAKTALGGGYALGSQGEALTPERLAQLVRWNGRSNYYFAGYSAERWLGKRCWDCSGLVVWVMQQLGLWAATEDYKAEGIWQAKATPIHKEQLQPGSLLFHWDATKGRMSHVGIYAGGNKVMEAAGTRSGVILSSLPGSWTHYGNLRHT